MLTGCLSAAPQRFVTVQTAFALSPASKYRSILILAASPQLVATTCAAPGNQKWKPGSTPPARGLKVEKKLYSATLSVRLITTRRLRVFRKLEARTEAIAVKQIVVAGGDVKQVARRDALWIVVIAFGIGPRHLNEF